jgi:aryl carrier-like protein
LKKYHTCSIHTSNFLTHSFKTNILSNETLKNLLEQYQKQYYTGPTSVHYHPQRAVIHLKMNPFSATLNSSNQSSGRVIEHTQLHGKPLELDEVENRLKQGLDSCRIKDVTQLSERIKRTEIRIQQYLDEDRNTESDRERLYLNDLKQLQGLSEALSFQSAAFLSEHLDKIPLSELEDRLRYGLEKCKIKQMTHTIERMRRAEKRIEQYEEEDRTEEAQYEMGHLRHLQVLQRIIEEIFLRKSTASSSKVITAEREKKRVDIPYWSFYPILNSDYLVKI